jgi:cellulose synthase/poly-beta-1,6-N-acetylglucosamine synthase-like glycosyltransferase
MPDIIAQFSELLIQHKGGLLALSWSILAVGLIQNAVFALQLPYAWAELREHSQAEDTESNWQMLISDVAIPISILVPAYNEEKTIASNVHAMLSLQYPTFEVVVSNDGSSDGTLQTLIEAFSLQPTIRAYQLNAPHAAIRGIYTSKSYPNLVIVDKEAGGCKADANNAALNLARYPLFCVTDADSLLEAESLLRAARPFMEEPKLMAAVGGTIRVLNGCTITDGKVARVGLSKCFLPRVQTMEYVRAFLMSRLAWSRWGMLSIVSGAFGVFRRDIAIQAGGYSKHTVGEDYDLIINMHKLLREQKRPYEMRYVPEPVCWTEAPSTWKDIASQRTRWQRGALEVFFNHRGMFLNPRYGKIGFGAFFHHFIVDILGPLIEVLGYCLIPLLWLMGLLNTDFVLAYVALFFMFGFFISTCSLFLEEMELRRVPDASDLARLSLTAFVENFGYRQLNNIWRFVGWWEYLRGVRGWGILQRKGFAALR